MIGLDRDQITEHWNTILYGTALEAKNGLESRLTRSSDLLESFAPKRGPFRRHALLLPLASFFPLSLLPPSRSCLAWLERNFFFPLSAIVGWNKGDKGPGMGKKREE